MIQTHIRLEQKQILVSHIGKGLGKAPKHAIQEGQKQLAFAAGQKQIHFHNEYGWGVFT